MRMARTVAMLGDVGGKMFHVGDEAMFDANVALLRDHAPDVTVRVLGRDATREEILDAIDGSDGAVIAGAGNLADGWPELLDQRLAMIEAASRRMVPVVTGGQTLVPAPAGERGAELARALATVELIGAREQPSVDLALELGLDPDRVVYQADDAFGMTGAPADDDAIRGVVEDGRYIAVTLDGSYAADEALPAIRSLASQVAALASELGLEIVFLPHCGVLGALEGDDPRAGERLAQHLRLAGACCHEVPVLPVEQAVWVSQGAALTISSRYHPLVFATSAAVPCVGLYRDTYTRAKIRGALAHVGAERWCLETTDAEGGALLAALRTLWAERTAVRKRAVDAIASIEEREATRRALLVERLGLGATRTACESPRAPARTTMRPMSVDPAVGEQPVAVPTITDEQWDRFARDGFMHLGEVLDADAIARLTQRADDLALGRVRNEHILMQLDTGGEYEALPEAVETFDEGTLLYRKIQGLELDEPFVGLIRHPRFLEVCARIYGPHVPLSIFRAMIMNKPAGQGTTLPWHQDGGDVWGLDREPLVTIWVALDPATTENGCMECVRGSHRLGLLSDHGSTLSDEDAARHCPADRVVPLEVPAGHAVLMHNWLIHRSGVNPSPIPRRAVTICYLDGRSRSVLTGDHFPVIAGTVDAAPHPYVRQLREDDGRLRESVARAEEYARSLEEALEATRAAQQEAERYAKSLEEERARLLAG